MLPLALDLPLGCQDDSKSRQISKQQQPASMLFLMLSRKRSSQTKSLISGELFYKRMEGLFPHAAHVKSVSNRVRKAQMVTVVRYVEMLLNGLPQSIA